MHNDATSFSSLEKIGHTGGLIPPLYYSFSRDLFAASHPLRINFQVRNARHRTKPQHVTGLTAFRLNFKPPSIPSSFLLYLVLILLHLTPNFPLYLSPFLPPHPSTNPVSVPPHFRDPSLCTT